MMQPATDANAAGRMPAAAHAGTRIEWVDYAKGIAILGVFVMHSAYPKGLTSVFSSFDMMVFFFLSGFVFSIRKHPGFWPFLWHRVRTLVIPGLVLAAVGDVITSVVNLALDGSVGNVMLHVVGYVVNLRGKEGFGQIPWFLTCLFVMEIMAYVLVRVTDGKRFRIRVYAVAALAFLVMGYAYSVLVHIVLPWAADVALALFPFFVLGMIARSVGEAFENMALRPMMMVPAAVLLAAGVVGNAVIGGEINPYLNRYGDFACYVAASVGGLVLVLSVCRWLEWHSARFVVLCRALRYWGRNTLVFYCVNEAMYSGLVPAMLRALGLDPDSGDFGMQMACGTFALVVNLVVCPCVAELVNRCFPQLLGRVRRFGEAEQGR